MNKKKLNINENDILFFDMDGTLVNTDFANFLSYKKAIQLFIQLGDEIQFNPDDRFNRTSLKIAFPNLTEKEYEKIIKKKEENYKEHLSETKLNKTVMNILLKYYKTNKTVLVTNCREDRALITLSYHNLTDKFSNIFFRTVSENGKRINKYKNAISSLSLSAQTVIVFENEKPEIEDAIRAGIFAKNIIKI
ncbi:HAD hydrolase-like protein [Cellulophaga baltica]|uniref:Beta-phosphoglucomutase, HAD superfamily n=1 Tax=Cellulophaga baltica TaxID=76594 RepID=A0A1G7FIJ5_9FLAO|nr:HAD hydrolase-like protein [Cellulophaga baltica]SDE75746.1 Beta-phosphoglucomutase, HAD superfamily [Cellulophaga baltica]